MSIQNILNRRDSKESAALLKRIADQKPNVTVTPTVTWPSDAEVTVKNPVKSVSVENFGDVLRSLALLGKGIEQLKGSVDLIELHIPDKAVQEVTGVVATDVSTAELEKQTAEVVKAVKALAKELKVLPKETKTEKVSVEIPKSFKIDNLSDLQAGLQAINNNLVKLADVVRDSKTELPNQDNSSVIGAVERVESAIKSMVFPIPQAGTPAFKNTSGEATSAVISNGAIPTYSPDTDITLRANYARKYYTNSGAVTDGIVWSPAAGKRWHITSLYIQVSADTVLTLEDDLVAGDDPLLKGEFKGGSGVVIPFDQEHPLASGEDAADLLVTTTAGNVYITAVGYEV